MNKVNSTKSRIFLLIGFMAAGKSFIGKKVAKELDCEYIDLDYFIEFNESASIKDIFTEKGEEYFRKVETEYFEKIIALNNYKLILSAGGGFPLKKENRILMKKVTTIFINTDLDTILTRLHSEEKTKRPLIANLDKEGIKKLYDERLVVYKAVADFTANSYNQVHDFMTNV